MIISSLQKQKRYYYFSLGCPENYLAIHSSALSITSRWNLSHSQVKSAMDFPLFLQFLASVSVTSLRCVRINRSHVGLSSWTVSDWSQRSRFDSSVACTTVSVINTFLLNDKKMVNMEKQQQWSADTEPIHHGNDLSKNHDEDVG